MISLNLSKEIGSKNDIMRMYEALAMCDSLSGNWKGSLAFYKLYKQFNDSIFNEESLEKTIEMSTRILLFIVVVLLLVIVFSVFMSNRYRVTQKQKKQIEEQQIITDQQKQLVEEKNKEITDSIHYAKRIQAAILPSDKLVKEHLKDSFIIYKPKDIVAGDFYWMETINSDESRVLSGEDPSLNTKNSPLVLFAAADCTGHGVPGAMVSVVCNNALNRSVREYGLTNPGEILDKTREIVIQEFEKSDEEVKDGMDIALCSLEFKVKSYELKYAGANNPLWVIRPLIASAMEQSLKKEQITSLPLGTRNDGNFELIEIKPNKQPIGKYLVSQPFITHTIELQKGDSIYIFSDGYADQFGGEKGKKFKLKSLKELILSVQDKDMLEQKQIIDKVFEDWKGNLDQIDDVCIIGVKV
ncbi:MAG: SpoIIE family protein phosphatase [Bacteroidetes bacterium]|nr:SpoIIE family protein phosphatase [Bacteroidota bacterium]